jgi:transposase
MEATGVYWIPVYEVLYRAGFEVHLVNPRAAKQVSGRKSDVLDCQWLWQLMSYGLLKGAFRPADPICELRSFVRQRARLTRDAALSTCRRL